eukprot:TRINITY_DN17659_c0_g1_i2.p2 TRINITY_DN17659_c0_g1~~TRINITY_DN17659_c0_g1_i2.p2  ORF type:complete len:165 (-),score=39.83 TRINITY_DN17659_c0_g1_i2:77-571(-)
MLRSLVGSEMCIRDSPECWSDGLPGPPGMTPGADCHAAVEAAVIAWIQAGGVRIDNGDSYLNMNAVGRGIARSGVPRERVFLVNKLGSPLGMGAADFIAQSEESLREYNTSYVDLLLVHWPTSPGNSSEPTRLLSISYAVFCLKKKKKKIKIHENYLNNKIQNI